MNAYCNRKGHRDAGSNPNVQVNDWFLLKLTDFMHSLVIGGN